MKNYGLTIITSMKRFIVIIGCILLSLTSCEKMKLEEQMRANKSYVSIDIDNIEYRSKEMNDLQYSVRSSSQLLDMYEGSFILDVEYQMTAKSGNSVVLNIRLKDNQPIQTGKTYIIPTDAKDLKLYSTAKITVKEDGVDRFYYAQNGSMVIDEIGQVEDLLAEEDDLDTTGPTFISGIFSFEAYDEITGKSITVSNGIFHRTFLTGHGTTLVSNR